MKNNNSKPTLTIGIPAHNEERNIVGLLQSLCSQNAKNYVLQKIIVACDGCTDNTVALVQSFAEKHKKISLISDGKRKGKANRLNELYSQATTDLLLSADADIMFPSKTEIDTLVAAMLADDRLLVVGPRYIPAPTKTFMGKCAEYSYKSFEEAILQLNNGNNMYALMGCCSLIREKLYKSFLYPAGTTSDQNYLFAKATQQSSHAFHLVRNAHVLFLPVTTFHDWRVLSSRSVVGDKANVVHHFGEEVLAMYTMPKELYMNALVKWFFIEPVYTTGAFVMNLIIRAFPYTAHMPKNGLWEIATSSKEAISL